MILEILKNPIVLGIFAGTIAYLYLLWDNEKKYKNIKDKNKGERIKKNINLMIPLIVSVIVCIISYAYFYSSSSPPEKKAVLDLTETLNVNNPKCETKFKFSDQDNFKQSLSSESAAEFHLISKGLNIPNKAVPEVFMETFT